MQAEQPTEEHASPETFRNQERHFSFCGHDLKITQHLKSLAIPAVIWPSGLTLCRYFEKARMNFTGKKVIELGSGTGLVGILAILLGGDVTLTDLPVVLNQLEDNVAKNIPPSMRRQARVCALRWGADQERFPSDYDVILGSDIVYFPRHFQFLINTLLHLSHPNTVIYLSSNMYHTMGADAFHKEMVPQHFNTEVVDRVEGKEISVFKITKKNLT